MTTRDCRYLLMQLLLLLGCATLSAQPTIFKKYTTADGLSDNTVLCGLCDSYGFMWLGTSNGLNCFDGTLNTIYQNMVEEGSTYENNIITSLFELDGDIWFGGSFGLYVYHRQSNSFSRFDRQTTYGVVIGSTVQRIVQGPDSLVWIGTLGQGLFIYDPRSGQLQQDSRHGAFITDIVNTGSNNMAAVTMYGNILFYQPDGTFVEQYSIPGYVSDKKTISLEYLPNHLFIGTDRGLYHLQKGQTTPLPLPLAGKSADIRTLRLKSSTELLCGTDQGIYTYNISTGATTRFDHPTDDLYGLSDVIVNELLWDRDSTLWVMTEMGGVNYLPNQRASVQTMHLPKRTADSQRKMIRAVCETPSGDLWVGSDEGLFYYDRTKQELSTAGFPDLRQEINVLMLDGDDLWIGTRHEGIIVMNTATRQLRRYQYSADRPYTVTSNEINSLLRTRSGDIYVGTSWSLCRFDRQTENFMWYAEIGSMTNVTHLCEDQNGCVWAASSNHGLFQQTAPRGGFRNYNYNRQVPGAITSNYVSTVFCDHSGVIWVATNGGGLCRFRPESADFERFGSDGSVLQEKQVYFIVEDNRHNLWMGSEDGMLMIDSTRTSSRVPMLPANGGILRAQKPRNSAVITANGELFSGRYDLLVHFRPDHIEFDRQSHPLYITSVTLPYHSDDGDVQLESRPLYTSGELSLPFADNSFTLHFSSPRFNEATTTRYEYMLKGLDNHWARGTKNAEATYANVPPGDYEFLLREAGNDNEADYARLRITVLPPWYRTTLAYVLYVLLLLAAIAAVVWRYNKVLKRRYSRRMRAFQTKQEKENFESKIRFFINLVHEIRTPLSLISLPLEQIEEDNNDEQTKVHTAAIRRNMNYLLGITNQLLDFQKAENGRVQLQLRRCDVGQLLRDVYEQFDDAMSVQGKHMQLQLPEQPISTSLDVDKIQKVMMNLVGNAVKYAHTEVIVRLEQTAVEQLCISVIDDGPGVPPAERDKIFDLYYQIGHDDVANTLGTGLGLSYAKMLAHAHNGDLQVKDAVGGGSNFMLTLPISEEAAAATTTAAATAAELKTVETLAETADEEQASASRTFHVLIVEDNEELLHMTSEALRRHYRILKARDGLEALDVLKHQDVDVIVSDVMMPRMDGIELCQHVKQHIEYSHIPVILLTAKTSVEAKLEGMQSGADIYLEKPFSAKQLHLQILSLLRMRQQFYERMRNLDSQSPATAMAEGELGMTQQDLLFMERLQQLIDENMRDEAFSIDILAEQMNMSRSSFYRKIKALTDITPIEYLKTKRLERAAQLLRQGSRINEVAERVGFSSSSYFAKCFRQKYGVLPKDYSDQKYSSSVSAEPSAD